MVSAPVEATALQELEYPVIHGIKHRPSCNQCLQRIVPPRNLRLYKILRVFFQGNKIPYLYPSLIIGIIDGNRFRISDLQKKRRTFKLIGAHPVFCDTGIRERKLLIFQHNTRNARPIAGKKTEVFRHPFRINLFLPNHIAIIVRIPSAF